MVMKHASFFKYHFEQKVCQTNICLSERNHEFNTLRTGDVDLRFYITTVEDG